MSIACILRIKSKDLWNAQITRPTVYTDISFRFVSVERFSELVWSEQKSAIKQPAVRIFAIYYRVVAHPPFFIIIIRK